jgi:hypothetical protein
MPDIKIVGGSTGPPLRFQVVEGDNDTPLSLVDKSVRIRFAVKGQQALWERDCTVDIEVEGKAHMDWTDTDLVESGTYEAQVIVEYGSGMIRLSEAFDIEVEREIPAPAPVP